MELYEQKVDEKETYALGLGSNACLGEIVLEMLYASEGHHTLPLGCTSAEWLDWLVSRVHVGVKCCLTTRFLDC